MSGPPKTILLVDDDNSVREVIKIALEAWGYRAWVAEDGQEALSLATTRNPDVVLSDIMMPRLDGLTLLRRLKRWDPRIPVILFTAHPTLTDAVSAMKNGASDVLTKPIDFKRLRIDLEQIFGNCGNSGSQTQNPEAGIPTSGC